MTKYRIYNFVGELLAILHARDESHAIQRALSMGIKDALMAKEME